jgi:hypothetical protein
MLPPAGSDSGLGLLLVTVVLTTISVTAGVLGGYKRIEKIMTALLVLILVAFIIVAVKGLLDWHTWPALAKGLVPTIPPPQPVVGGAPGAARDGFTASPRVEARGSVCRQAHSSLNQHRSPAQRLRIRTSPNSLHFTSVAPSIRRAKS